MEQEQPKKSLAELKIDIIEVVVNSPVGIGMEPNELFPFFEKCADFVISYKFQKLTKENGV